MRTAAGRVSPRSLAAALVPLLAAGCLKTSPVTDPAQQQPDPPPPDTCDASPAMPAGVPFALSGAVTYDLVPARYSPAAATGGLYFGSATQQPVRSAVVQIRQCGTVLAETATDAATGRYQASFTPGASGPVVVYVLARVASPPITVRDAGGAIWAVGAVAADASGTLDVHATHGWTGTGYGPGRIAAPFAILDTMYAAATRLLAVRDVPFDTVPLTVNWSPDFTTATNSIGTSFYEPSTKQIFVLGGAGDDTDEFDREVIAHEWSHYLEDAFSRSDSPGGNHGLGDVLDPRVAFDEGSASALAAILLQDPMYADTFWDPLMDAFGWDAENAPTRYTDDPQPGPFSEITVIRALYDLYDPGSGEAWDGIAVGVGPLYDTLAGPHRTTAALATIASFVAGLEQQPGVDPAAVNAVLAHYAIGPITTEWGDGDASLRATYTNVAAPSATPYGLTATLNGQYQYNERPENQYYVFTATGARAQVTASAAYDVDLYALEAGSVRAAAESSASSETITFATTPGHVYVVILTGYAGYDLYGNFTPLASPGTYPVTLTFSAP